jgi:hypothetical protein
VVCSIATTLWHFDAAEWAHQTEKNSVPAYVFGFTLSTGHCSAQSALRIWAKSRHPSVACRQFTSRRADRTNDPPPLPAKSKNGCRGLTVQARRHLVDAEALYVWGPFHVQQRHRIFWALQIGSPIVRGSARNPPDAWKVDDGLIELHHDRDDECQNPAIVGVSFLIAFSSPGATTMESAERIGMRPVMNEARPAVQLA